LYRRWLLPFLSHASTWMIYMIVVVLVFFVLKRKEESLCFLCFKNVIVLVIKIALSLYPYHQVCIVLNTNLPVHTSPSNGTEKNKITHTQPTKSTSAQYCTKLPIAVEFNGATTRRNIIGFNLDKD